MFQGIPSKIFSGTSRNRTNDTRIFSPLLYLLSYGTNLNDFDGTKVKQFFESTTKKNNFSFFLQKRIRYLCGLIQ